MKAIETHYKGYRFRSRLEARWAVYFDADGIEWEYEKEGYSLPGVGLYLPDFWLPRVKMFAEVKPGEFSESELDRCRALARHSGCPVLLLDGSPDYRSYYAVEQGFAGDAGIGWDYIVSTGGENYYESEKRFFVSTGEENYPTPGRAQWIEESIHRHAIDASRSARFEHGESGPPVKAERGGMSSEEAALREKIAECDRRLVAAPLEKKDGIFIEKRDLYIRLKEFTKDRWVGR